MVRKSPDDSTTESNLRSEKFSTNTGGSLVAVLQLEFEAYCDQREQPIPDRSELIQEFKIYLRNKYSGTVLNDLLQYIERDFLPDGESLSFEDISNNHLNSQDIYRDPSAFSDAIISTTAIPPKESLENAVNTIGDSMSDIQRKLGTSVTGVNKAGWLAYVGARTIGARVHLPFGSTLTHVGELSDLVMKYLNSRKTGDTISRDNLLDTHKQTINRAVTKASEDREEQVLLKALIDKMRQALSQIDGISPRNIAQYDRIFREGNMKHINIHATIQTLDTRKNALRGFFSSNNISEDTQETLRNYMQGVTNQDLLESSQKIGGFTADMKKTVLDNDAAKPLRSWHPLYKKLFNTISKVQLANIIESADETIQTNVEQLYEGLDVNGSLSDIFGAHYQDVADEDLYDVPGVPSSYVDEYQNIQSELFEAREKYKDINSPHYGDNEYEVHIQELQKQRDKLYWRLMARYIGTDLARVGNASAQEYADIIITMATQEVINIGLLSHAQQNSLLQACAKKYLESDAVTSMINLTGIDGPAYREFVLDMYNLDVKETTINTPFGPKTLKMDNKGRDSMALAPMSFEKFISGKHIPFHVTIDTQDEELEAFLATMLSDTVGKRTHFYTFSPDENDPENITYFSPDYKVSLASSHHFGNQVFEGYLSPQGDIDNIPDKYNFTEEENAEYYFLYTEPVTARSSTRELVVDKDGDPVILAPDHSKYTLHVHDQDKHLTLSGSDMGRLMMAYALADVVNDEQSFNTYVKDQVDKFEEGFKDTYENNKDKAPDILNEDKREFFEKLGQLEPKGECTPDTLQDTELYIADDSFHIRMPGGGRARRKISFHGEDDKNGVPHMRMKIQGKDLGMDLGSQEGRSFAMPMSGESIDRIQEVFGSDIYKVPVAREDFDTDMQEWKQSMGNSGMHTAMFDELDFDSSSRAFRKGSENVEYFAPKQGVDPTKDQPILYKLRSLGDNSFELSTEHMEYLRDDQDNVVRKNGKPVGNRRQKKITLDNKGLITFLADNNLYAQDPDSVQRIKTLQEQEDAEVSMPGRGLQLTTLGAFFKIIKNITGKVGEQFKKKDEEYLYNLEHSLLTKGRLLEKIGGFFPSFLIDFDAIQDEHDKEASSAVYGKISDYLKYFQEKHHSQAYPLIIQLGEACKNASNGKLSYKKRLKAAAALMRTLEKGHGPYGRGMAQFPKGMRVRMLFGASMQEKFLAIYKQEEERMRGDENYDRNEDRLNMLEYQFITDNIFGAELSVSDKFAKEARSLFSRQYGGELKGKTDEYFRNMPSKKNEEVKELDGMPFEKLLSNEMRSRIKNNRAGSVCAALKAGAKTAKKKHEFSQYLLAFSASMLGGIIGKETTQDMRYDMAALARSSGCILGTWCTDPQQQEKIFRVLDFVTDGSLSMHLEEQGVTKETLAGNNRAQYMAKFLKGYRSFWAANEDTVTSFLALKNLKAGSSNDLISLAHGTGEFDGRAVDSEVQIYAKELVESLNEGAATSNIDSDVKNGTLLSHNVFGISPAMCSQYANVDNDGNFSPSYGGNDRSIATKHAKVSQDFWKAVETQSNEAFANSLDPLVERTKIVFYLKKFFSFFGSIYGGKQQELCTVLSTLKHEKNTNSRRRQIIDFFLQGWLRTKYKNNVPPELRAAIMSYAQFFYKNIDSLTTSMCREAFKTDGEAFGNPLSYTIDYDEYKSLRKKGKIQTGRGDTNDWLEESIYSLDNQYSKITNGSSLWKSVAKIRQLNPSDTITKKPKDVKVINMHDRKNASLAARSRPEIKETNERKRVYYWSDLSDAEQQRLLNSVSRNDNELYEDDVLKPNAIDLLNQLFPKIQYYREAPERESRRAA